jgi:hypothetical protein
MTSNQPKEKAHGSSHQCKQWRKKKRPKQGLWERQQEWCWARQKRHQDGSRLWQPDLFQGRDQEHDGDEYFDHISNFSTPPGDCTWFGFQNTDRWQEKAHPPPMVTNWSKSFCQQLVKYHFSGFGGAEHGLDFCQLPAEDQWWERVQGTGLGKNKATFAANTAKECGRLPATRYGGTFMISTGETVNHVVEEGEDFTGLGRFAYQIVQGKHGHHTVFVSGYRPNKSEPT